MKLVTVANVEIVRTGKYKLSSGEHTFTKEQIAAAIKNAAGKTPRLGIGHVDPRFDGQPAIGQVTNLRASDDGETLMGDYVNVPDWLAKALPSGFPGRSIEGSCSGDDLTITAVKLLGTTMPGVSSLKDIQQMFSYEGPVMVAAGEDADGRETTVIIDVTGSGPGPQDEASSDDNNEEEPTVDPQKVRKALGLADDASDEDVDKALDEEIAAAEAEEAEGDDDKDRESEDEKDKSTDSDEEDNKDKDVTATVGADGTVVLDKDTYTRLLAGASAGIDARAEQLKGEREQLVASAIKDGRIPPARKEHWLKQLEVDPESKSILAALQPGLIPVDERGHNDNTEQQDAAVGTGLLPELAASAAGKE